MLSPVGKGGGSTPPPPSSVSMRVCPDPDWYPPTADR